jgi:hypothetical protein
LEDNHESDDEKDAAKRKENDHRFRAQCNMK